MLHVFNSAQGANGRLRVAPRPIYSATLAKSVQKRKDARSYGNPSHSEKCPLATMFYGKRRWPDGDGNITAEDNVFLSNLNPRPK